MTDPRAEEWRIRYEIVTSGMKLTPETVEMIKQISDKVVDLSTSTRLPIWEAVEVVSSALTMVNKR